MKLHRRGVLGAGTALALGVIGRLVAGSNALFSKTRPTFSYLRPPGTEDEQDFLAKCIRCRACANVCEAGCINFFTLSDSPDLAGTPYINPRIKACNLCTNCTNVCPTSALKPIKRDLNELAQKVKMGKAVVLESHCLSHNGRICGVCRDACPLSGKAIKLVPIAKPKVIEDACIGCGRCEERCPQYPSAIIVRREVHSV